MAYTEKDYKEFRSLRDCCSLKGFDNYRRNIARLDMDKFLKKFSKKDIKAMFDRDNKEHNIKE